VGVIFFICAVRNLGGVMLTAVVLWGVGMALGLAGLIYEEGKKDGVCK
jgi:hypothetical protein